MKNITIWNKTLFSKCQKPMKFIVSIIPQQSCLVYKKKKMKDIHIYKEFLQINKKKTDTSIKL